LCYIDAKQIGTVVNDAVGDAADGLAGDLESIVIVT
jgi:hypothetical protein